MRLQYYINEGYRSKEVDKEWWYKQVTKECTSAIKAMKKGNTIYRGIPQGKGDEYFVVDPKKGKARRSAYTSNYYTYILSKAPAWKKYPPRQRSIICSTSQDTAQGFGYDYIVLPVNGAKIGVAPIFDFWGGFDGTMTGNSGDTLDDFNRQLEDLFIKASVSLKQNSYAAFAKSMKDFDKAVKGRGRDDMLIGQSIDVVFKKYYKGDLLKALHEVFDPEKNGFQLKTIGDPLPKDKEVWTDAKSYMISSDEGVNF